MICGALQTLNEDAFEDVVASERPSPTGGPSTGETIALTPIQESAEHERSIAYSNDGTTDRLQLNTISFSTNIGSYNNNNNTINNNNINNNNNNNSSHSFSISNMNKNNSMVTAVTDKTNNSNANDIKMNSLSGLNVHEQMQLHVKSIKNSTSSSQMFDHNNHTAISIASTSTSSPSSSTVILMPDAKGTCSDTKVSIDDTRL